MGREACLVSGKRIGEIKYANCNVGYRAYQQMKATAKPCDGMPMRVKKRVV